MQNKDDKPKEIKTITIQDIRSYNPCYDPNRYLSEDFNGTLTELLRMTSIPAKDRLWVVVRSYNMSSMQLRQYGLSCARLCESYTKDPRVKECNDATELCLKGNLSLEELNKFRNAAANAAAAAYAATYAAYAANAAYAATYAAAAANAAAYAAYAADAAAYAAAADAANAYATANATYAAAARAEMQEKQCSLLIYILNNF